MSEIKLTFRLDNIALSSTKGTIDLDLEYLHGEAVSADLATVILLRQIDDKLRRIEEILVDSTL